MSLTPLPTAPSRSDSPSIFVARSDAFVAALPGLVDEINAFGAALNNLSTTSTSATAILIGLGAKTMTVETGKSYQIGMTVKIAYTANPTQWILGEVSSYNSGTGALGVVSETISGAGTWSSWTVSLAATGGAALTANSFTGPQNEAKAVNIASAATVNLDNSTGNLVHITGNAAISAITLAAGAERTVVFDSTPSLSNSASLIFFTNMGLVAQAGDTAIFRGEGSGVTRCISYTRRTGLAINANGIVSQTILGSGSGNYTPPAGYSRLHVMLMSGGASGASRLTTGNAAGGSSGAVAEWWLSNNVGTIAYTIGPGGAAVSGNSNGNPGGDSSITHSGATFTLKGGAAGVGAALAAISSSGIPGYPAMFAGATTDTLYSMAAATTAATTLSTVYNANGGCVLATNVAVNAGCSIQGGAGGAAISSAGSVGQPGICVLSGNTGGVASLTTNGGDGVGFASGGAGAVNGYYSGAGSQGVLIVTAYN